MIELWHEWNSVHSFKVRVVLQEKGVAWTDRTVELLRFEHLSPSYLRLNPNGVVPTLVHDGEAVLESSIICQYLDDLFPDPALLPAAPRQRARCRAWLKYFDDMVHPAVRKASFEMLYRPHLACMPPSELRERLRFHPDPVRAAAFLKAAEGLPDPCAVAESLKAFERIVLQIEGCLREREWLSGDAFGMADVAMAPFVERLDILALNALWTQPRGRAWAQRVMQRPSVLQSRAPARYRLPK